MSFLLAGILSATLAVILKELDPILKIEIYEVLGSEAGTCRSRCCYPTSALRLNLELVNVQRNPVR